MWCKTGEPELSQVNNIVSFARNCGILGYGI